MRCCTTSLAVVAVLLVTQGSDPARALGLPPYIKPCAKNDPNLSDCALKHGREAMPNIIKGDRKYGVPVLNPVTLDKFVVEPNEGAVGLGFTASNIKIYGLLDAKLDGLKVDLDKRHFECTLSLPVVQATADYDVAGKILILPIKGKGDANLTMTRVSGTYAFDLELAKKADGLSYGKPINTKLTYAIDGRTYVTLNNLFNGDKLLGDAMNDFINENWRDIEVEMGPRISGVMKDIITDILFSIFDHVPYENAFPDTV